MIGTVLCAWLRYPGRGARATRLIARAAEGVEGFKGKTVAGGGQGPAQPSRTDGLGGLGTTHAQVTVASGALALCVIARWHTLG